MKTIKWIIKVIKSCNKLSQLNDTLSLIESYRRLNSKSCTLDQEIKMLYRSFQRQQKQILNSI